MKNTIAVVIIVLCLATAGLVLFRNWSRPPAGAESLRKGEVVWVQCSAPGCGAVCQMDRREYFGQVDARRQADPRLESLPTAPPLTCPTCGKETAWRAVKCQTCGHVFPYGVRTSKEFDYADRCPKCGTSKIEQDRKAAETLLQQTDGVQR